MKIMRRYVYRGAALLAAAVGMLAGPDAVCADEPGARDAHHIYLHVVPPADGGRVQLVLSEYPHTPEPPPPTAESPEPDTEPVADPPLPDTDAAEPDDPPAKDPDGTTPAEDIEDALAVPLPPPELPPSATEQADAAAPGGPPLGLLLFIFILAIFLGFELISKVPSQLHTPLMSGSNAISGITIVGALAAAGLGAGGGFGTLLGTLAVAFAAINVFGGYLVTDRMLGMFKKKDGGSP